MRPYRKWLEQKNPTATRPKIAHSRIEGELILSGTGESGPLWRDSGVVRLSNQHEIADLKPAIRLRTRKIEAYSAAAAKADFGFADDTMKSEMRGTISDLKREPLNTP
jgi:hypothetical protein